MLQWVETIKSIQGEDGTNTFEPEYTLKWKEDFVNSSNFDSSSFENNFITPYDCWEKTAKNVSIGSFEMNDDFINDLNQYKHYPIRDFKHSKKYIKLLQSGNIYITTDSLTSFENPQLGDILIEYYTVSEGPYTISPNKLKTHLNLT